jgi:hypothetical protein
MGVRVGVTVDTVCRESEIPHRPMLIIDYLPSQTRRGTSKRERGQSRASTANSAPWSSETNLRQKFVKSNGWPHSLAPGTREPLAALLSEMHTLAGWQALDLCDISDSWQHYEQSRSTAANPTPSHTNLTPPPNRCLSSSTPEQPGRQ